MFKQFKHIIKIYYEDTDSGGVVYYANYLKFIERARSNMIQELGFSLKSLSEQYDCHFVVKNINCDYIQSAKLEDDLTVQTKFLNIKNVSFELEQNIFRNNELIFKSKVIMVNINSSGKPVRMPQSLLSVIMKND